MKPDEPTRDENQGEGDRISVRHPRRRVREFVASPQPTKVTLDELVAKGRTVVDRVGSVVRRIADRLRRPG